jgi:hypothetical protein
MAAGLIITGCGLDDRTASCTFSLSQSVTTAHNKWLPKSRSILVPLNSHSQSYIATDGQSVSKSWCSQLRSCFCVAPSLRRGLVCLSYMLLALASVVFLGSESHGTRVNLLLSQIWDFRFRRLLRLAGSRWRYSTPPPYGLGLFIQFCSTYIVSMQTHIKHIRCPTKNICVPHRKHLLCCQECVFIGLLRSNESTCHIIYNTYTTYARARTRAYTDGKSHK